MGEGAGGWGSAARNVNRSENLPHQRLYPSIADAIGNTPLVELSRITRGLKGHIFAKLEFLNPGYSKKDRIARQMIEDAETEGALRPGDTVVELTSGNTGTRLCDRLRRQRLPLCRSDVPRQLDRTRPHDDRARR